MSRAGEMTTTESQIELDLLAKLGDLKYTYRPDIRDRAALEANFREKFEALNRVRLTDSEFQRLLDGVITPDVYNAVQTLRNINSFERDDGTPLNYTLVNIKDWCKNHFEAINQLRINTDNSHHRYDVNGEEIDEPLSDEDIHRFAIFSIQTAAINLPPQLDLFE
jgi:type I restriction enzyme R subunit